MRLIEAKSNISWITCQKYKMLFQNQTRKIYDDSDLIIPFSKNHFVCPCASYHLKRFHVAEVCQNLANFRAVTACPTQMP